MRVACVNPADLDGKGGVADSYFLTRGFLNDAGGPNQPDWITPPRPITTPFVKTPGLVSTHCAENAEFDYLALHVNTDPRGKRTNRLAGEIVRPFGVDYSWGLHILDVDHSIGNLISIVQAQSQAYTRANRDTSR